MLKVKNKETLCLLAFRFLKMNRGRNILAVAAIALTSLLFTSIFTGTYSMFLSKRTTECKNNMAFEHAAADNMTEEEFDRAKEAVRKDPDVARYGEGIFLGLLSEEKLGCQAEVRYADQVRAESVQSLPKKGRLPKKKNEIALSTVVLDSLQVPRKLGEELTLTVEVNALTGEKQTDTFTLCGYWEGDPSNRFQMAWVSKEYVLELVPQAQKKDLQNGYYQGGRELSVWFRNVWNLEKKTERLSDAAGFQVVQGETYFRENPAYLMFGEDGFSIKNLLMISIFVMLAGYLIIYNIFSISVNTDIRAYGLLKNVGTTGRQLKKIVHMQAFVLSALGIPAGLAAGAIAGKRMTPYLMADINAGEGQVVVSSVNLWIFLAAAVFSWMTVYTAAYPACKKVQKVSPVEALKLSESGNGNKKEKASGRVSWAGMALLHFKQNLGKNLVVMISISLSLVTFNCVMMLVQGFDFDEFLSIYADADFQVSQCGPTLTNGESLHGVDAQMRDIIEQCPDVKSAGYVYYREEVHKMEPELETFCKEKYRELKGNYGGYEKNIWKQMFESGKIRLHFMGISQTVFEKLEWERECNWEDFASGDYVLVADPAGFEFTEEEWYPAGSDFTMQYQNGESKTYQVLGETRIPYSLDYPYADYTYSYMTVLVPEQEFISRTGEDGAMLAAMDAKEGREKQVSAYLKKNLLDQNSLLYMQSILDLREGFGAYRDKYYMIGGTLAAVLALIGIINFFNTTAAQALARKRELTLLEAVGMTGRQIRRMLVGEGFLHLFGAVLLAVFIVVFFAETLLANTVGMMFFLHLKMNVTPCLLLVPVLAVIAGMVPAYHYRRVKKESLVDRLRES